MAKSVGIARELFAGWEGHELALYRDTVARSRSAEVGARVAREKAARQGWVLDLGLRAVALPCAQGEALQAKLDQAAVSYERGSVTDAYIRRVHRVTAAHPDILRKLAAR
jgi:hypothetical protein